MKLINLCVRYRKEFGDYTTDDMKLIIEAQKNKGLV